MGSSILVRGKQEPSMLVMPKLVLAPHLCVAAQTTGVQPWLQHTVLNEYKVCMAA